MTISADRSVDAVSDLDLAVLPTSEPSDLRLEIEGAEPLALTRWERTYSRMLRLQDAVLVSIATLAGYSVRFADVPAHVHSSATQFALALPFVWVLALASKRTYAPRHLGHSEEFRQVFEVCVRVAAVVGTGAYLLDARVSRVFVGVALGLGSVLLLSGRVAAQKVLRRMRAQGRCLHRVVAVGTVEDVRHLVEQAAKAPGAGFRVTAACVPSNQSHLVIGSEVIPVAGRPDQAVEVAHRVLADTVAVVTAHGVLGRAELRRLSWELEGTAMRLLLAPAITDVAGPRITVKPLAGLPLLHVEQPSLGGARTAMKSLADRTMALLLVCLLAPLYLVIAVAIAVDSPGPVLYRQTRVGLRGRVFTCLKFRSMRVGADREISTLIDLNEHDGVMFKIRNDPRVTRVGKLIRKLSLDELPQLFNVLSGSMALVGPRPPLPNEVDRYAVDVHRRLLVKPGVTGLWQVSGRSDLTWEESVRLDLYYVENWSPMLDLAILARTARAVIKGHGAY